MRLSACVLCRGRSAVGYADQAFKTHRHLFLRRDDPEGRWLSEHGKTAPSQGERFNIEATGPDVHMLSDETYRSEWPRPIPQEYIDIGLFLKSLTPEEELSEFLSMRGFCLLSNERLLEAIKCFKCACRLVPHNTIRHAFLEKLMEWWQEGQPVVLPSYYVPPPRPAEPPKWPQWINVNGLRMLVQYPQTGNGQESSATDVGRSLRGRDGDRSSY